MTKQVAVASIVALLAMARPAVAQQQVVFTNIVDGHRVDAIVKVMRDARPAAPVPPSITTTQVVPANWRPPMGPTYDLPPVPVPVAVTQPRRERPVPQPWYVNGIYMGPSPNGNWMATAVGRPTIDVNIVGVSTPRQRRAAPPPPDMERTSRRGR